MKGKGRGRRKGEEEKVEGERGNRKGGNGKMGNVKREKGNGERGKRRKIEREKGSKKIFFYKLYSDTLLVPLFKKSHKSLVFLPKKLQIVTFT